MFWKSQLKYVKKKCYLLELNVANENWKPRPQKNQKKYQTRIVKTVFCRKINARYFSFYVRIDCFFGKILAFLLML